MKNSLFILDEMHFTELTRSTVNRVLTSINKEFSININNPDSRVEC